MSHHREPSLGLVRGVTRHSEQGVSTAWQRLHWLTRACSSAALVAALVAPVPLRADDDMTPATTETQESGTEVLRVRRTFERDNSQVLSAFQAVIGSAPNCTVEITDGQKRIALGTIVSNDGEVLTKASLLSGLPTIVLPSGEHLEASILGIDVVEDLALLKVEHQDLQPVRWRDGDLPELGSWVITADYGQQVQSIGVISVLPRSIPKERGALGIRMDPDAEGVVIAAYSGDDTPAEKAGIRIGDRVIEVNDEPVESMVDLQTAIAQASPGDAVILTVERDGNTLAIQVILANLALIDPNARQREMQETLGADLSIVRTGFSQALQHDTPLSPMNCGGPLFDLQGNAVGLNIARAGRVNSYSLTPSLVQERLTSLRSGELTPETVFAERITRLTTAVTRLTSRIAEELEPKLSEVDSELKTLQESEPMREAALEEAEKLLEELRKQISALNDSRQELDGRIQAIKERQSEYERQIEQLRRGVLPR
ncbi:MAG: PDZ domain-containing protein [Planctomycetales bacterium]|nr:PDZ domain-containing protein [Planctomycetales bacterium]